MTSPRPPEGEILFREEQWLASNHVLLVVLVAVPILLLGLFHPLLGAEAAAASFESASKTERTVVVCALAATQGLFFLLFFASRLVTEVRTDGVYVQFRPLTRRRRIAWEEIDRAEIRTYAPLKEYGGYGIRRGSAGKAYNIRGDQGLQLVHRDGGRLLIGTQRPSELWNALRRGELEPDNQTSA